MKWFITHTGRVRGPFTSDELNSEINRLNSNERPSYFFWSRGLGDWLPANKWSIDLAQQTQKQINFSKSQFKEENKVSEPSPPLEVKPQTPKNNTFLTLLDSPTEEPDLEKTVTHVKPLEYQVMVNQVQYKPMSSEELFSFLSSYKGNYSEILMKESSTRNWGTIFEFPFLVDSLKISRRRSMRVPLMGQLIGQSENNSNIDFKIVTISEGGIGLTQCFQLVSQEVVDGQITSPKFFKPIPVKARVVYTGLDGYVGLEFTEVSEEGLIAIKKYVEGFGSKPTPPKKVP